MAFAKRKYFLLLAFLTVYGCKTVNLRHYKSEKIYSSKNTSLKLDGYYSYNYDSLFYPMFLYSDGTCLDLGGFSSNEELTAYLKNDLTGNDLKNYRRVDSGWGGFYLQGDEIIIQTVVSLSSGGIPVSIGVLEHRGVTVSDSAFRIKQRVVPQRGESRSVDVLYRYHPYPFKPDSANWVKERIKGKK